MNNPYFNSNKRGIPTVATTAVNTTSGSTTTALVLPHNTFLGTWYQGIIFVEISQDIPDTTTNEVVLEVNGEARPLVPADGSNATVENIAGGGAVFQVYYDKPRNYLQLMTPMQGATITEIKSNASGGGTQTT